MKSEYVPLPKIIQSFFKDQGQRLEYNKKQILVRYDDPQPWVYFLDKGLVEVTHSLEDGASRILGYFVENMIFAQNRLFDEDSEGDLQYLATENVVIYRVHKDVFLKELAKDHGFTQEYLASSLLMRIYTTDLVIYLGENRIHNRFIRWLLLMAKYYGEDTKEGRRIMITLTQDVVANFLHTSRESVSKVINKFIRDGQISTEKKQITIKDIAKLKQCLEY